MAMKVRVLLSSVAFLTTMWLVGCGHYTCGVTFGNSTCTPSAGGVSQGGGGTSASATAFAFAVDSTGTIDSFTLSSGAATFAATPNYTGPIVPTNSEGSGMVVAQGKYLYTAFPGTGQIFGWTISASGGLTAINSSPFGAPYMIGSTLGGTQSMITNPAGTLLFVLNQSGNAVYVYQINSGGVLTATGLPLLLPFEPGNMATDGLGKYLYVSNVVAGDATDEIGAYVIGNGSSLAAIPGSPFASTGASLEYSMRQLQGDPSGKYMIGTTASVTGDNHLYVFSIQPTGAIIPVSGSPFLTVYSPYAIAVQPSTGGDLVYSFSLNSTGTGIAYNPVEGYQLNTSTGALKAIPGSPFLTVATGGWGQFDQSGAFLFVYANTLTQLAPLTVGSGGVLTQPIAPATTTVGYWAVTDAP